MPSTRSFSPSFGQNLSDDFEFLLRRTRLSYCSNVQGPNETRENSTSTPDVGLGSRVSEFQRGLGLGSRSSREGWVSGLGLWGPPEAGFWSLNQVKTGKFRHGARQNCIFPSFMQRKSPAEHLHISDTSDSNVGFWVLDQKKFGYNTKLPLHRSARSARQFF